MSSASALWAAKHNPPADATHLSFRDKAVLVTGANSGLGHAAAIKYARQGANPLILAVRTAEKGEQAKAAILAQSGCPPDIFVILTVDLASLDSVRAFVAALRTTLGEHRRLDVAQLAAGIATWAYEKSPHGYELSLQVNVLSTALLGVLLLPLLSRPSPADDTPPAHLSLVNSIASMEVSKEELERASVVSTFPAKSLIDHINDEKKFDNQRQYFLVKLAAWFVMQGLVQQQRKSGGGGAGSGAQKVVINASDPGLCKTAMLRNFPFIVKAIMAVRYWILGRSVEEGARTLVSATGLGVESNGKFWRNDAYSELSELIESEEGRELGRKTWEDVLGILRAGGYVD